MPVAVWPVRKRCGLSIQPEQLLCPVLVGREDELALLRGALECAVEGRARGPLLGAVAGRRSDGGPAPWVLLLEDLPWDDESRVVWLQVLLLSTTALGGDESVPGQGLLVVGTFRDEGPATAPTLARTVSMLLAKRV